LDGWKLKSAPMLTRLFGNLALSQMLRALSKILVLSAFLFSLVVTAQERQGWQFGSTEAVSGLTRSDTQQVCELLLRMLDRWNAHDIDGHLEAYWRSADLLVVVDSSREPTFRPDPDD
jgi:hypothetical protein